MTEIKPLTQELLEDFFVVLAESNEEPLTEAEKTQLRNDFAASRYTGWLLYSAGELAGMAIVMNSYSVAHARTVLYLDELFIRTGFRGKGFGKMLFEHVATSAKETGDMRLEWRTKKDNAVAQSLYAHYTTDTDWIWYGMKL